MMPCIRMESARSLRASGSKLFLGWVEQLSTWLMGSSREEARSS